MGDVKSQNSRTTRNLAAQMCDLETPLPLSGSKRKGGALQMYHDLLLFALDVTNLKQVV